MEINLRQVNIRLFIAVAVVAAAFVLLIPRTAQAGLAENVSGWAWSGSVGWISLNCTNNDTCDSVDYGVTLVDIEELEGWADLFGWAWSETVGWICFGQTCGGVTPEGGPAYAQYRDFYEDRSDEIYGWARIESLGDDGWISLNCDNLNECAASNYHLVIDPLSGNFTQGLFSDHWAWGGNDEVEGAGWVDFSWTQTLWTASRLGTILRPEGIYEPENVALRGTHLSLVQIGFVGLSAAQDFLLECDLTLADGSRRQLRKVLPETIRDGVESLEYAVTNLDAITENTLWTIDACRIGGYLSLINCVSDAQCAVDQFCDEIGGFCRTRVREKVRKWPIFTHSNTWLGLGLNEDQYNALRCQAGFAGNYFNNSANCDFPGDASFSLLMRRGVPLEGNCHDGLDNDGNGEIDCADRYCRGISYRCQTLPRTFCLWGAVGDGLIDCSDPAYEIGQLCCGQQPPSPVTPDIQQIVDGLECSYGDPNDGYFDCDCTSEERFNESPDDDCFAPGYSAGDLCCTADSDVVIE
ncbi:hypothetical protein KKF05_00640 [Patescibacteria group bacterium]|nr:hypothetical protein [Patescibacteria group bacterium]MBU1029507.1 hypothetical protein [Patescibacteria group bacterium]MBU1916277.1 hypothetical protein [Patescibacteria group bacterium]